MKYLQSHEIQALNESGKIQQVFAVKKEFYELVILTADADSQLKSLVTQKNALRQFKTLDAVETYLTRIEICKFLVLSYKIFKEDY
jgi:hypothetical protein